MKLNYTQIYLFVLLLFCFSCGTDEGEDDPGPDPISKAETQLNKLKDKIWTLQEALRDDENVTAFFSGFTINFNGSLNNSKDNVNGTFTTQNGGELFPANGSWSFVQNDVENKIILNDRETTYTLSNNNQSLQLDFQHQSDNGRVMGVSGNYSFTLTSQ